MEKLVAEFKSVYKEKGPHDLRSQVKYLSALADHYYKQGLTNSDWVSLLKAHTLYNSVAARDRDNEIIWSLRAFNVQNTYWKSRGLKPDLLYERQREITNSLKNELADLRKTTKAKVNNIKTVCSQFHSQPDLNLLSSPENLQSYKQFMDMVEDTSGYCTKGVIDIFHLVIRRAEEIIGQSPCQLCVAALGSLARGEATPYSDMEFLFLIGESSNDSVRYFETLALTVYFLIGNLQETKLRYMAIEELADWFEDVSTNGLKIDGLQKVAGNIPTGNGTPEQHNHFICTVDQLADKYHKVYDNPDPKESLRGDFSAMLSSTVYIYGNADLLSSFQSRIQSATAMPTNEREQASMKMLLNDTQNYDFFPDYTLSLTRNLKVDIYRYPSMLILNLRIIHRLFSLLPLNAVTELVQLKVLSASIGDCLKFSFCCALYMRLSAYLHLHSQNENMSVLKSNADIFPLKRYQWFVDRTLFLHMMIQLMPLKTAISNGKLHETVELNSHHVQICVARVSYYCLDYRFCYTILHGETDCTDALLYTRAALHCAYFDDALHRCTQYLKVVTKLSDRENTSDVVQCYSLIARIKWAKGSYVEAEEYFDRCLKLQKSAHDNDSDHQRLAVCYSHMGNLYLEQGQYDQAATFHKSSLEIFQQRHGDSDHPEMARCYSNLGKLYFEQGQYRQARWYHTKALDMSKRIYGNCDHPVIAQSYYHLGDLHRNHGVYGEALICHIKSLEMRKRVFGNLDHPEIATCYIDLGNLHSDQGQYDPARSCYMKALKMLHRIYSKSSHPSAYGDGDHPEIATCYYVLSKLYTRCGQYPRAKIDCIRSLEMCVRVYGIGDGDTTHPKVAMCYNHLGNLHMKSGLYDSASDCHGKSLKIHRQVYGDSEHPDIAKCYSNLGHLYEVQEQLEKANKFYNKSLLMCKNVYGNCDHPAIANCYYILGKLRVRQEDYHQGMIYCIKALEMCRRVYDGSDHPEIAMCYAILGNLYMTSEYYRNHELAEYYYRKSLGILQIVYQDYEHPDIGECYRSLGHVYTQQHKYREAEDSYERALSAFRGVYGTESKHIDIEQCQNSLQSMHLASDV